MIFDGARADNTQYVATISRGKDSIAMLHVIKDVLHWPLDRIVTVHVWATQDVPAELPPMVAWQDECDKRIEQMFGVPVERLFAKDKDGNKVSYNDIFYRVITPRRRRAREAESKSGATQTVCDEQSVRISRSKRSMVQLDAEGETVNRYGFPSIGRRWCTGELKNTVSKQIYGFPIRGGDWCTACLKEDCFKFSNKPREQGAKINTVQYIGIAADEPKRIEKHQDKKNIVMPLVEAGWTEKMCYEWCQDNGLLAPTYTTSMRDGCWFCHNQRVNQLRNLWKNYPELWQMLLKWDDDSPVSFHADGHTVHDFDKRFELEDAGQIDTTKRFLWKMIEQ